MTQEQLKEHFLQYAEYNLNSETILQAVGDGSICDNVNNEVVFFSCAFNSHSAALGIGKLFSSIPSKSSNVLPTAPLLLFLKFSIQPLFLIFFNSCIKLSLV